MSNKSYIKLFVRTFYSGAMPHVSLFTIPHNSIIFFTKKKIYNGG